jgi:hypothetical protein
MSSALAPALAPRLLSRARVSQPLSLVVRNEIGQKLVVSEPEGVFFSPDITAEGVLGIDHHVYSIDEPRRSMEAHYCRERWNLKKATRK